MKNRLHQFLAALLGVALVSYGIGVMSPRKAKAATALSAVISGGLYNSTTSGITATAGFISSTDQAKLAFLGPSLINVDAASVVALPSYTTSGGPGAGFTLTFTASPAAIDGVTMAAGKTVLLQHGASRADNGVYRWVTYASGGAGTLVRVPGFDTASNIPGSRVVVRQGTRRGGSRHTHMNRGAITMGTTGIFYHNDGPASDYGRVYFSDFVSGSAVAANTSTNFGFDFSAIAIGTGTLCSMAPTAAAPLRIADGVPINTSAILGLYGCSSGTTAPGYAGLIDGVYVTATTVPDGGSAFTIAQDIGFTLEARVMVPVLSTGAQEYAVIFGAVGDRTASQKGSNNMVGISYDRTGSATTKWLAAAVSAGVSTGTATDTGITVTAQQFYVLEAHKDIGSNDVVLSIDRTVVATYNTNIPSTLVSFQSMLYSNVGTTPKGYVHDWWRLSYQTPQGRA